MTLDLSKINLYVLSSTPDTGMGLLHHAEEEGWVIKDNVKISSEEKEPELTESEKDSGVKLTRETMVFTTTDKKGAPVKFKASTAVVNQWFGQSTETDEFGNGEFLKGSNHNSSSHQCPTIITMTEAQRSLRWEDL